MRRTPRIASPAQRYAAVVRAFAREASVTLGGGRKRGFGSNALTVKAKIFAMLTSRNIFVVKLPQERVAALVAQGTGQSFALGPGRVMKEWLEVCAGHEGDWLALAREARAFVAGKS